MGRAVPDLGRRCARVPLGDRQRPGAEQLRHHLERQRDQAAGACPSDRPDWSLFGSAGGGGNPPAAGTLQWEAAHHGSGGFLAYLITGDYVHLETMEAQAATCYLSAGSGYGRGFGTARDFLGQTRGEAWSERTVGQLVGIGPSGDAIVEDYRAMLQNIGARWLAVAQTPGINRLGYLYDYDIASGAHSTTVGIVAPWQQHFWMQTLGAISDLEHFADMTTWNAFRDHLYTGVVGILGGAGTSEFGHARAAGYTMRIADTPTGDPGAWYDSWGMVYERSFGMPNAGGDEMLGRSTIPTGYWGNLLPAIAYAVDDGAPGAAAAWARLTASSNWSTFAGSGFADTPLW
ncbi:MAG: hypothetical protein H0X45_05725, partial [Planctomycetes bacterium]|nr:hypothetical protein [Planctomycetota bacterium]